MSKNIIPLTIEQYMSLLDKGYDFMNNACFKLKDILIFYKDCENGLVALINYYDKTFRAANSTDIDDEELCSDNAQIPSNTYNTLEIFTNSKLCKDGNNNFF